MGSESITERSTTSAGAAGDVFVPTHWSVVLTAGQSDTPRAREALGRLYQTYWYPLYAYLRRRGYNPHDAQDLTQEFFARLLEHNWLARADQQKGRFRSFLLGALNHFLANEWDKARAWKRGGRLEFVPLQFDTAEGRYNDEPADPVTPEQCYERRWALALLDEVVTRLRQEHERDGQAEFGSLGQYVQDPRLYRCPADKSRVRIDGQVFDRTRSTSMNAYMNGLGQWQSSNFVTFRKTGDIPRPSDFWVFLGEREDSINDGYFATAMELTYGIVDYPASYHNGSGGLTFADGHAEYHRWLEPTTMPVLRPGEHLQMGYKFTSLQDRDMAWLNEHTTLKK